MNQPYACVNQPYATLTLALALREMFEHCQSAIVQK